MMLILTFIESSISGSTYDGSYARSRVGIESIDSPSVVVMCVFNAIGAFVSALRHIECIFMLCEY